MNSARTMFTPTMFSRRRAIGIIQIMIIVITVIIIVIRTISAILVAITIIAVLKRGGGCC